MHLKNFIVINQMNFSKLNGADLVDATIFKYIAEFAISPSSKKKLINNKVFSWVSYQKIIDDNPMLMINNTDVIARRVSKIISYGILEKHTAKEEGNKTYFAVTELGHKHFIDDNPIDFETVTPSDSKVGTLPTEESEPLPTQKSDNRKLNDRKLNIDTPLNPPKGESEKIKEKNFSFSLKKKSEYNNLSKEYKQKLFEYAKTKDDAKELEQFIDYCIANGKVYKDWAAAYRNWIRNAEKYKQNKTSAFNKRNNKHWKNGNELKDVDWSDVDSGGLAW